MNTAVYLSFLLSFIQLTIADLKFDDGCHKYADKLSYDFSIAIDMAMTAQRHLQKKTKKAKLMYDALMLPKLYSRLKKPDPTRTDTDDPLGYLWKQYGTKDMWNYVTGVFATISKIGEDPSSIEMTVFCDESHFRIEELSWKRYSTLAWKDTTWLVKGDDGTQEAVVAPMDREMDYTTGEIAPIGSDQMFNTEWKQKGDWVGCSPGGNPVAYLIHGSVKQAGELSETRMVLCPSFFSFQDSRPTFDDVMYGGLGKEPLKNTLDGNMPTAAIILHELVHWAGGAYPWFHLRFHYDYSSAEYRRIASPSIIGDYSTYHFLDVAKYRTDKNPRCFITAASYDKLACGLYLQLYADADGKRLPNPKPSYWHRGLLLRDTLEAPKKKDVKTQWDKERQSLATNPSPPTTTQTRRRQRRLHPRSNNDNEIDDPDDFNPPSSAALAQELAALDVDALVDDAVPIDYNKPMCGAKPSTTVKKLAFATTSFPAMTDEAEAVGVATSTISEEAMAQALFGSGSGMVLATAGSGASQSTVAAGTTATATTTTTTTTTTASDSQPTCDDS